MSVVPEPRKRFLWRLLAAVLIGGVSEIFPVLGLIPAAVFFPEGVHSSNPDLFIILVFLFNFLIVASIAYWIAGRILRSRSTKTVIPR